ncbi:hypothetical protein QL992_04820 [Microbacterium sp. APC 3898]|uniref:Uncharacterized protein n=1 Tax=Planococcus notacanthi TaxID=3035188 RepID=A0ABT7ZLA0_9BACL|nr:MULTISPECIES: hypothetical protein [Terrabacteria group]MDN3427938.1 hypothetical protein [Planococcus sp. APC 4016]MDN3498527.1 hypothetical protein [Microbacterium sp. APC 3898]
MKANKVKGSIIIFSHIYSLITKVGNIHHSSPKGGPKMLTETLALEYAKHSIKIKSIASRTITISGKRTQEQSVDEKRKGAPENHD